MKKKVSDRATAFVAGCALLVSMGISSPALAGSVSINRAFSETINPVKDPKESFSLELKRLPNTSTIHLVVQKPLGKRVWIIFRGPDGEEIERIATNKKEPGIFRNYNFSDAIEGTYSFEISDGTHTVKRLVRIASITPKTIQELILE